jgi:hypothetical protein
MELEWKKYKTLGEQAELEQRFDKAEAMCSMAALIAEHNSTVYLAFSLDRLSNSLLKQQKSDLALYFLRRSWHLKTKVLNSPDIDRAVTLNLMAEQCFKSRKLVEAQQLLKQVLEIYIASFGKDDRRTQAAAGNLDILTKMAAEAAHPAPPSSVPSAASAPAQSANPSAAAAVAPAQTSNPSPPPASSSNAPAQNPAPVVSSTTSAISLPAQGQGSSGIRTAIRSENYQNRPRCERCGAVMLGEDCLQCTGTSIKAISPLDRLV